MNKELIIKYKETIDEISNKYNYDYNIKHLLYLIIPAFISKYKNPKLVIDTFTSTPIIISNKTTKNINAFYTSIPKHNNNNITTDKYIIINNYQNISLINLLDSLVHEYNHAINSYLKEIEIKNDIIYLRTGLTHITYNKDTLKTIEKLPTYILEEIINTKQTEEVIDIIKNYHDNSIEELNNTIYAINAETSSNYESKAYYLETKILNKLISNKTFIYTLETLRLEGNIDDIEHWFNNITGDNKSYENLIKYLNKLMKLEEKLSTTKYFKKITLNKIRTQIDNINRIINNFNSNCNYR